MKVTQNILEKQELRYSEKQDNEDEKTVLMKEYEAKLYNIAYEMDRITSQLREKNKQLDEQREVYMENYSLSEQYNQQLSNLNNSFQQLKTQFHSPLKNDITLKSIDQPSLNDIKEINELQKENNQLKHSQLLYESEVQDLKKYIQKIQVNFEIYQNDISLQKSRMQQNIQEVQQDQKYINSTLALANELSNLIKVVKSKDDQIKELKFQNGQLDNQLLQCEREKQTLQTIIQLQASQIDAQSRIEQVIKNHALQSASNNHNGNSNINNNNSGSTANLLNSNLRVQTQQNHQNEFINKSMGQQSNINGIQPNTQDLQPISLNHYDASIRQVNQYYLVTPKSNVTNHQSDYTNKSTNRADEWIHSQKHDFTRASQYFLNHSRNEQTPNYKSDLSTNSRIDITSNSLSPVVKTSPKIINLSAKQI